MVTPEREKARRRKREEKRRSCDWFRRLLHVLYLARAFVIVVVDTMSVTITAFANCPPAESELRKRFGSSSAFIFDCAEPRPHRATCPEPPACLYCVYQPYRPPPPSSIGPPHSVNPTLSSASLRVQNQHALQLYQMPSFAATRIVNPPGASPTLTRDQVWKGLLRKIREPQEFVKAISSCRIEVDEPGKVRQLFYRLSRDRSGAHVLLVMIRSQGQPLQIHSVLVAPSLSSLSVPVQIVRQVRFGEGPEVKEEVTFFEPTIVRFLSRAFLPCSL